MEKHEFKLRSGNKEITVIVSQDGNTGLLEICPVGYGDDLSVDGEGCPVLLDLFDGKLKLHVWSDINKEDPTHQINLEGALETNRKAENEV